MTQPRIFGLIGYPVKHSLSLVMQNAAFSYLKKTHPEFSAEYRLFEVKPQDLEDFLLKDIPFKDIHGDSVFTAEIEGFNITIPHKVRSREILEKRFPLPRGAYMQQQDLYYVELSGAINTVRRQDNQLQYCNTDAAGFLESLREDLGFEAKGKNALVIGCGGAGRAIVAALSWKEVGIGRIYINDINANAIESCRQHFSQFAYLKDKLEFISTENIPKIMPQINLFVNASPQGMNDKDGPVIDKELLRKDLFVFDVVYNRKTQLIKDARSLGLPAVDGLSMLLYQGVRAFEFWTGEKAPQEVMRRSLAEALNR